MDRIDVAYIIEYRTFMISLTNCHKWNVLVRKKYQKLQLYQIIERIKSSQKKVFNEKATFNGC